MRERLIRLRHLEHILLLFDGAALIGRGIEEFEGELVGHRDTLARAGGIEDPADGEGHLALGIYFDRHLVDRTGDALGTDFDERRHIQEGLGEDLGWRFLGARFDDLEGIGDDAARDRFFSLLHDAVDELFHQRIGADGDVLLDGFGHGRERIMERWWK